jgi:hypothetical protein
MAQSHAQTGQTAPKANGAEGEQLGVCALLGYQADGPGMVLRRAKSFFTQGKVLVLTAADRSKAFATG